MRGALVLALCACGRIGFETAGGGGPGNTRDGNDGDGAENATMPDAFVRGDVSIVNNIAFVTEAVVTIGTLGSIAAADAVCQNAADAAGLPGTYIAWLSTSTQNAIDRLAGARGWVRVDGVPFIDLPAELAGSRLRSPLSLTADGQSAFAAAATGTRPNGTFGQACTDLTSTTGLVDHGTATTVTADWTWYSYSWGACDQPSRLYCFGIENGNPLVTEDVPGRLAFLSATTWQPGSLIASADALCQSDAAAAGVPNATSFRALLATTTATAASRFSDGLPWKRADGILWAATAQDVFAGAYRVPLNVFADGTYWGATGSGAVAWLGAATPDQLGTLTCQDWSVSNNGNTGSTVNSVSTNVSGGSMYGCNAMNHVWCLEP